MSDNTSDHWSSSGFALQVLLKNPGEVTVTAAKRKAKSPGSSVLGCTAAGLSAGGGTEVDVSHTPHTATDEALLRVCEADEASQVPPAAVILHDKHCLQFTAPADLVKVHVGCVYLGLLVFVCFPPLFLPVIHSAVVISPHRTNGG